MFRNAEIKYHLSVTQITCELINLDKKEHLQNHQTASTQSCALTNHTQ